MFIAVATGNILNHLHVSVAPLLKKKIYLRLYFCLSVSSLFLEEPVPWEGCVCGGGNLAAEYVILSLFLCFQYLGLVLNNMNAKIAKKILTITTQILTTLAGLFLPCSGL